MPGCKVGDLVYVNKDMTNPHVPTYGRITTVISRQDADDGDVAWRVHPPVHPSHFGMINDQKYNFPGDWMRDKYLTPIRDQPGEDEMLRIAGKPKEIENV